LTASRTGKHVLIVDDDRAILGLVEQWLTAAGYSVVACDRFETAKQHLADAQPDVLLTDVRLGAFNGLQLVILAKEMGPHTAVVMSAFDDPMLRKDANLCGAGYLTKPFTRDQVLAALEEAPLTKE
jgi:two-component system, NtrC family, C4-dicarboxylate transport response regulator DctD